MVAVIGGCEGSAVLAVVELNTKVISRIVWLCARTRILLLIVLNSSHCRLFDIGYNSHRSNYLGEMRKVRKVVVRVGLVSTGLVFGPFFAYFNNLVN